LTRTGALLLVSAGVASTALTLSVAGQASEVRNSAPCGRERWNVKTLVDPAARKIDYAARRATVEELRELPRPPAIAPTAARARPFEFRTYVLRAGLVKVRRSKSLDLLLVIRGRDPSSTMLVAFPDTHACLEVAAGPRGGEIHSATDSLIADCGPAFPSQRWQKLAGTATITGVGFFDLRHAKPTDGEAPNGFRLHPALRFRAANCRFADD
jgi:hypothetical protein